MHATKKISLRQIALAAAAVMMPGLAEAQHISIDGRLSAGQTLVGPNYTIGANLGKQVGGNLFQSFGIFGLTKGESATFSGPATVTNVIGRVTGGNQSSIDGAVKSTIAGANVYLINPAGFLFGPNATVNISGSFHAATADYLKLADGTRFQATNPGASTLSAAAPAAFGFLNAAPPAITVNGSVLGVPQGQTLGLAGGTISVTAATLRAPAGAIRLASVASTGEVPAAPGNAPSTVTARGAINITQGAIIDVSDRNGRNSGGNAHLHAGNLTIDNSEINADNYGTGAGGTLSLRGDNSLSITGNAFVHAAARSSGTGASIVLSTAPRGSLLIDNSEVLARSGGAGATGSIDISADQITVTNNGFIASLAVGSGNGGPVNVTANSLSITNGGSIGSEAGGTAQGSNLSLNVTGLFSIVGPFAGIDVFSDPGSAANAGAVKINAANMSIVDGQVGSFTAGAGTSGGLSLTVPGTLSIAAPLGIPDFLVGVTTGTNPGSSGNSAPLSISAANLVLTAGGVISSSTAGTGNAGNVSLNIAGAMTVDGTGAASGLSTGVTAAGGDGNGGAVSVTAASLSLSNRGQISSSAPGRGNGGVISVNVAGLVSIAGDRAGLTSQNSTGSTGNAGSISLIAGGLTIAGGGLLTTATHGGGTGGDVAARIAGAMSLSGAGPQITASTTAAGHAGSVAVAAGSLSLASGASITSDTTGGSGDAGSVFLSVAGPVTIDGGPNSVSTGVFSQANPGSTGKAGTILVEAGSLSMTPGGRISTTTFGTGAGGDVSVFVAGPLSITGTTGSANTGIFSEAAAGSGGNAGTVLVDAGSLSLARGGAISSTSFARGNAGEVTVDAGSLAVAGGGQISSSTLGTGAGGDVVVDVQRTIALSDKNSQITALSNGAGDAGSIIVNAADVTLKDGAAITTRAKTANGGNIKLAVRDFLYLLDSEITTSVLGAEGNGGNILIDPHLVVLDGGDIIAQAVAGHGGNIQINVGNLIASTDSLVSASSQLGISGTVDVVGPREDLNGSLVVLPSDLRGAAEVARTSCDARARKESSLVDAGHGGLPQDTESTIPALYIVNRDLRLDAAPAVGRKAGDAGWLSPLPPTARLTLGCG